jgi:hypothetical protein
METTETTQLISAINYQSKELDQLKKTFQEVIAFLEYENAFTTDKMTERRVRLKLIELGIWPSQQKN